MSNRNDSIDALKGLLMLAVMLGHSRLLMAANELSLFSILYTFHIPGFFFVAALLNRSALSPVKIRTKAISYLYPHLIFFAAASAVHLLLIPHPAATLQGWLFAMISGNGLMTKPYSGLQSLWYLPAIYCFYVVSGIYNGLQNRYARTAMLALPFIAVLYAFSMQYPLRYIPFGLPAVAFIFPVAIAVRSMADRYGNSLWLYAGSLITAVALLPQMQHSSFNLATPWFFSLDQPAMLIAALLFMTSMFFLLLKASSLLSNNRLLRYIGRYSLEIYLVHNLIDIMLVHGIATKLGLPRIGVTAIVVGVLFFFITLALSLLVAYLAEKTSVRHLFRPPSLPERKMARAPQ